MSDCIGFNDWFAKHNDYSSADVDYIWDEILSGNEQMFSGLISSDPVMRRRSIRAISYRLPCRPALRFLYHYMVRFGFLDLRPGLTYCTLLAVYEYMISVKLKERRRMNDHHANTPG